ncbi:glycosyltransferase family 32 protein [Clostridium fungisolvens]
MEDYENDFVNRRNKNMSIPKIIHYCWFGKKEKSNIINKCITSWKKLDGFIIKEWNEDNFDVKSNTYIKEAYEKKKYAFVSDYVRLKVLSDFGGVYFDTDVEVKKDISGFLDNDFFIGFMYDSLLGTAVIGSVSNHMIINELLKKYDGKLLKYEANNNLFTKYFLDNFSKFKLNNKYQVLDNNVVVYPKEYFERPTFSSSKGFTEHHYTATWKEGDKSKKILKSMGKFLLRKTIYKKITGKIAIKNTPFYNIYKLHKNK